MKCDCCIILKRDVSILPISSVFEYLIVGIFLDQWRTRWMANTIKFKKRSHDSHPSFLPLVEEEQKTGSGGCKHSTAFSSIILFARLPQALLYGKGAFNGIIVNWCWVRQEKPFQVELWRCFHSGNMKSSIKELKCANYNITRNKKTWTASHGSLPFLYKRI